MNAKIYTSEQANRTLPLIRAIVRDIVSKCKRIETAKRELRKASARRPRFGDDGSATSTLDGEVGKELEKLEAEIEEHRSELEELGCYLRDPIEKGLVDFPGVVDDAGTDLVCLCWHMGEDRVSFYHGMREGFSDRKPIHCHDHVEESSLTTRSEPRPRSS